MKDFHGGSLCLMELCDIYQLDHIVYILWSLDHYKHGANPVPQTITMVNPAENDLYCPTIITTPSYFEAKDRIFDCSVKSMLSQSNTLFTLSDCKTCTTYPAEIIYAFHLDIINCLAFRMLYIPKFVASFQDFYSRTLKICFKITIHARNKSKRFQVEHYPQAAHSNNQYVGKKLLL